MAVIHQGPNELQSKMDDYRRAREPFLFARAFNKHLARQRSAKRAGIIMLIAGVCVLAFAAVNVFFFRGGLVAGAFRLMLSWSENVELSFSLADASNSNSFLLIALDVIIHFVTRPLRFIISKLLLLLAPFASLSVIIVLFVLPVSAIWIAKNALWGAEQPFVHTYTESGEERVLRIGKEGEENALAILNRLDDTCHLFTNLRIPYDGGVSETDLIAVTPKGITIIEVKNHKGVIRGDADDEQLLQAKTSRRGVVREEPFYNPVKQVATHAYRLSGWLRENGVSAYVRTCVLFVHPEAALSMTDKNKVSALRCPVFTVSQSAALVSYVKGAAPSSFDNARCAELLTGLTERQNAEFEARKAG
ncbi:MAG: NERD domain-containing protein [Clostridia bacterium]|nr:NERD domain-containing protein [Clostridia bacterium]